MDFGDPTDPLTFILMQSFTRAVRQFYYITVGFRFVLLILSLRGHSIDNQFREAYAKLIIAHTEKKRKKRKKSDPSNRKNPFITLAF